MASTFAVTRNHLIFGLCLPLAVLLGYMLADIDDPASRLVVLVALGILAVPVLMRWHHPMLIFCWNLAAQPALPGNPQIWAMMAFVSLFFAVLNRSVNVEHQFAKVPALTRPMVAFSLVVLATAFLTGGIGLRVFGSSAMGGRSYFYVLAAVAGFFALSSRSIPRNRAMLYIGLFFLPGVSSIFSRVASLMGPKVAGLVYLIFPPTDFRTDTAFVDPTAGLDMVRVGALVGASVSVFCWMLARYGIAGSFDLSRPWRFGLLAGSVIASLFGGFRSVVLLMGLVFVILFFIEKLWRTRLALVLAALAVLSGAGVVGFTDRLPLSVQRTLSFLPLNIDRATKESAESSTQWRVEMWKVLLPQVPQYLFKGKGYAISSDDMFMAQMSVGFGHSASWEGAAMSGEYHNGPLSVVIPFGIYGLIAFVWLLVAGTRFLYRVHRESPPELRQINALLLALFLARGMFFFFVFGSLYAELYYFTGILGLSVALNVTAEVRPEELPAAATSDVA
jgi:hypothetical protein